ncbi:hypothetical protein PHYSODRAFT_527432 [Phytophthora sojae]|uniref:Uncharacterized protein n=1 Tax=Phytophthora sojae (strain P6497) TaxID=1094619 RepID=G5A8U4_PHYSP|nr:hypothetical protein PHYSODRAFT_527432 [Phytophthora sojae]EGZ08320.1 hypothetical protein PHYSODRAFT_527432 [Phytophthora sojae]|eukprot:XP_009536492.1 hypothetical protein PHYSODRAFT_527432 [Phytophthora sojae]
MCDPTTIRVAAALDNFALQLEGWNHWLPEEIPTLVLWINATLERYRNAAAQDALSGGNPRFEATGWFTTTNPDLQALEVVAALPRKDGKKVCVRFLSKRGCASADPTVCKFPNLVHFEPATIDPIVRDYINTKLGGISDKFSQSS